MNSDNQLLNFESLLDALALVGEASWDELATLLSVATQTGDSQRLTAQPGICRVEDRFSIDSKSGLRQLESFQRHDPNLFARLFDQHATRLMQEDGAAFAALVERIAVLTLQHPSAVQLFTYFQAVYLSRQDRYQEAIAQLEQLLTNPVLDPSLRGRALNSQSIYLQITGQLERAVDGYQAALELWRSLGNRNREAMALLNLGILYYQLQQYTSAESNLLAADVAFRAVQNDYQLASVQNQLGLLYRDQGLLDKALTSFDAVAAQRKAILDFESLGRALNNRGEVLLFQGKWDAAEVDFIEALDRMQSRTFAVDAHLNLGLVRQLRGDLDAARERFQQALDIAQQIGRRDILAEIYYRLGDLLWRLGDDVAALIHLETAANVIESSHSDMRNEALRIGLLGRWQQIYEALVLHCFRLDDWQRAFLWAERARARALQARLSLHDQEVDRSHVVAQLLERLPDGELFLCYFTIGVLAQDMPLLSALTLDHPLRQHLLLPPTTLCFEFRNHMLHVRDCWLDPNALVTLSPRQDRSRLLLPAVLKRLHTHLIPADLAHLTRIAIAPHGPLHQIPFAALLDDAGKPLLHPDQPPLIYMPSGAILAQRLGTLSPQPTGDACVAVGCDASGNWGMLRHTEREAEWIARLCDGSAFTGEEPKLAVLRSVVKNVRWLHFACHGWFDGQSPLDSYLQTGSDERLTAQEVLRDWQLQAELVTLSACQSGVQQVLRSDEPMGLVRGFLYAGARSVLATQWPIADLPTFLLMLHFYRQLVEEDVSPAIALRNSQCWLRMLTGAEVAQIVTQLPGQFDELPTDNAPFSDPRFWAAFVLYG